MLGGGEFETPSFKGGKDRHKKQRMEGKISPWEARRKGLPQSTF